MARAMAPNSDKCRKDDDGAVDDEFPLLCSRLLLPLSVGGVPLLVSVACWMGDPVVVSIVLGAFVGRGVATPVGTLVGGTVGVRVGEIVGMLVGMEFQMAGPGFSGLWKRL